MLAFFDNEDAADRAVASLKVWDKSNAYIELDSIGVLVKDKKGAINEHKLGRRAGKTGMGIGLVLGAIASIPAGGLPLIGGLLVGGAVGSLFNKGQKMTKEEMTRIGGELNTGHAAVGVLAWDSDAELVGTKLVEFGGSLQTHALITPPQ